MRIDVIISAVGEHLDRPALDITMSYVTHSVDELQCDRCNANHMDAFRARADNLYDYNHGVVHSRGTWWEVQSMAANKHGSHPRLADYELICLGCNANHMACPKCSTKILRTNRYADNFANPVSLAGETGVTLAKYLGINLGEEGVPQWEFTGGSLGVHVRDLPPGPWHVNEHSLSIDREMLEMLEPSDLCAPSMEAGKREEAAYAEYCARALESVWWREPHVYHNWSCQKCSERIVTLYENRVDGTAPYAVTRLKFAYVKSEARRPLAACLDDESDADEPGADESKSSENESGPE